MYNEKIVKNSFLKHSIRYDFLDSTICIASFPGYMIIGQIETDTNSNMRFVENKALAICDLDLLGFVHSVKKGHQSYENESLDTFEYDVEPPKKQEPLRKLCAIYSKADDDSDFIFQLR